MIGWRCPQCERVHPPRRDCPCGVYYNDSRAYQVHLHGPRPRPRLIAYQDSDGIENALYPSRYQVLSTRPQDFPAALEAAQAMAGELLDYGGPSYSFAVDYGHKVQPYPPARRTPAQRAAYAKGQQDRDRGIVDGFAMISDAYRDGLESAL